jgi:hypothetical protein
MGTTAEKLTHLSQTKSDIRDAIIAKGVSVPAETTFRDYTTKVGDIKTDFSDTFNYAERVSQDGGSVENLAGVANLDFNDGAKLNFIPSGKKAEKSYSQVPADASGDWAVDRNCEAKYIDKDGVMQTAQPNEPRYDWSSGSPVLLREKQSTNLLSNSNNTQSVIRMTTSVSGIKMLDDVSFFNSALETTDNGSHFIYNSCLFNNNNEHTFSVFIKPNGRTQIGLNYTTNTGLDIPSIFDFNYEIFVTQGNFSDLRFEKFSNGVYRVSWTGSPQTTNSSFYLRTAINGNTSFVGDSSLGFYYWGIQIEEGSKATSYIKTEGSTKTRLKDTITVSPPAGTSQIIETIDGVEQTPITTIPATYEVSEGNINQIKML